jgi:hypothetical protein
MKSTQPLTPRQCAAVLAGLTTLATVTAAFLWGTGCASTPGPARDDMAPASTWHAEDMRFGRWWLP